MKRIMLYTLAAYMVSMAAIFGVYTAVRVIGSGNAVQADDQRLDAAALDRAQAWLEENGGE